MEITLGLIVSEKRAFSRYKRISICGHSANVLRRAEGTYHSSSIRDDLSIRAVAKEMMMLIMIFEKI